MDFSEPTSHADIRELANKILGDHSAPERLKGLESQWPYMDTELWQAMLEAGFSAAPLPEGNDGMDEGIAGACVIARAIGETAVSVPYIPCVIGTALPLASVLASEEGVAELLNGIGSGTRLATTAFVEPLNEDALRPVTRAEKAGDDWLLSGTKHCVPFGLQADTALVTATTGGELWVGLIDLKQPEIERQSQTGTSSEPWAHLTLNKAKAQHLASGDTAELLINTSLAMTRVGLCSMAAGIGHRMTRLAAEYTSERKQFGVAIATFQAVAHRLADCYIDAERLKIITEKAVSDVAAGNVQSDAVLQAKMLCGDVMHRISHAAQHVHGGAGIDRDYPLWRYCLWAKHVEMVAGGSQESLSALADRIEHRYLTA